MMIFLFSLSASAFAFLARGLMAARNVSFLCGLARGFSGRGGEGGVVYGVCVGGVCACMKYSIYVYTGLGKELFLFLNICCICKYII